MSAAIPYVIDGEPWHGPDTREDAPKRRVLPLIPFADLKPGAERTYLVKGILPRVGIAAIWGPPKCGKSFWLFDLLMHVALGWTYRDHRVQQGVVVYCAFEGAEGFKARAEAFRRKHSIDGPVPLYLMPMRIELVKDHPALIAEIRRQLGDDVRPAAIALDTLNRSITGSESNDGDMGAYVGAADALRETFDCLVPIVHHCGVDVTRPRGHTSLTGAVEAQIAVKRVAGGSFSVTVEYMKDGPEGLTFACRLETLQVGTDADGDPQTSCVVMASDEQAQTDDGSKLNANQKIMFSFIHAAGKNGLTTDEWNEQARGVGIGAKRRADLHDIRTALLGKGLIRKYGERWTVAPC